MILVGLSGGLASGKSTAARMLADRGAALIDADAIARSVLEPGRPAHRRVVERFGQEIAGADGSIDRRRLAGIVFADPAARADLEAITHPEIYAEIHRRLAGLRDHGGVVVLDAALLVETLPDRGRSLGMSALVIVASEVADQLERAVTERGMTREDAAARIAAQAPWAKKLAAADYIVENRRDLAELERNVEVLWRDLLRRFGTAPSAGR